MNLFIHGIDGKIELGNSYTDDQHADAARPTTSSPIRRSTTAPRARTAGARTRSRQGPAAARLGGPSGCPLSPRNANTMWMLHFLYHLKDGGTAGFVMATGELSNSETARLEVRKALVEQDYVDCIVQLTGQLFANTQIPCACGSCRRTATADAMASASAKGEILFIDGRKLGALIPGSRKQKQLSDGGDRAHRGGVSTL